MKNSLVQNVLFPKKKIKQKEKMPETTSDETFIWPLKETIYNIPREYFTPEPMMDMTPPHPPMMDMTPPPPSMMGMRNMESQYSQSHNKPQPPRRMTSPPTDYLPRRRLPIPSLQPARRNANMKPLVSNTSRRSIKTQNYIPY